jgi:hypothetical protein
VLSELIEPLPQRTVGHPQLLGDVLHRSPVDEHGPQRFIAAVMRIAWLSEEGTASGVVHDPFSPKVSMRFAEESGQIVNLPGRRRPGEPSLNAVKTDFLPTTIPLPR